MERKTMTVELPNTLQGRLSLHDFQLWTSLLGKYFVFEWDPLSEIKNPLDPEPSHGELWQLGDVELDFYTLEQSTLSFHVARDSSRIVKRLWLDWGTRDFEVITEFSRGDKKMLLEHLGFVPEGWKR